MRAEATKDLGRLVFMVLTPALLFRTMSTVHVEQLDYRPVAAYFTAVIALFLFHGVHRFVTTLNDYGLRGGHATMALFVGIATLLTLVTAGLLLGIGF